MRELKFRGKDLKTGEWAYGDLHTLCDHPHIHTEVTSYPFAGKRSFVNPDTIGQFTGMRDDSGTEIWEGDIVRMTDRPYNLVDIGKVIYNAQLGHYSLEVVKGNETRRYAFIKSEIVNDGNARVPVTYLYEVIGNIFDNPELLK